MEEISLVSLAYYVALVVIGALFLRLILAALLGLLVYRVVAKMNKRGLIAWSCAK
jgi:predicted PurR-regulated permease PerM